jgi:hypothetical protein
MTGQTPAAWRRERRAIIADDDFTQEYSDCAA